MRNLGWLFVVSVLLVGAAACSGDSSTDGPTLVTPIASPAATATPAGTAFGDLSLVYLDASKGQGSELYVAAADGATPKKVATLANGAKVLDVRGRNVAVASQMQIMLIDLTTGASKPFTAPNFVIAGRFISDSALIFTTSGGCGSGGKVESTIYKLDTGTLQQSTLLSSPTNNVSITSIDVAAGTLATTPLGCDVGVRSVVLYRIADGMKLQSVDAIGCGWLNVAIGVKKVLVSWRLCNPPADKTGVDATIYDYSGASVVAKDLKAPAGGSTTRPWLLRPSKPQVALATAQAGTPGPGFGTKSTGLWTMDLTTLDFVSLTPGEGSEQWPVAWSADGRYLLYATVQAQGLCSYAYLDSASNFAMKTIASEITFCGANGDMIGWTLLK